MRTQDARLTQGSLHRSSDQAQRRGLSASAEVSCCAIRHVVNMKVRRWVLAGAKFILTTKDRDVSSVRRDFRR